MNSESFIGLAQNMQQEIFRKMRDFLVLRGFHLLFTNDKQSEADLIGLSEIKRDRQEDAFFAASFRKYYHDANYIDVHTTFDENLQTFTKTGRIGVLVKRPSSKNEKRVRFQIYFNREGNMMSRLEAIVTYLDTVLASVPRDSQGKPMLLVREKGDPDVWYFQGCNKEKIDLFSEEFFLLPGISREIEDCVMEIVNSRISYRENKEPGSKHIREIKDGRTAKRPEEEIPRNFD